ncbi:DUF2894 domain-containing protein [Hydrogenophaga sp. OTU3427]|uniref:DUF2894 domain-containing protein n=1 Tax=Hydrogenophaga sp. OTU3427 TaxID=3043856 RepID=UPI00313B04F4
MSDAGTIDPPPSLATLRSEGAQHVDPVRFQHLERLSQRLATQPPEVQRVLEAKLASGLAACAERVRQGRRLAQAEAAALLATQPQLARELRRLLVVGDPAGVRRLGLQASAAQPCAPLAELNRHIQQARQEPVPDAGLDGDIGAPSEMKSLRRFRESWSRIVAEDQVAQAIGRAPDNAGPLNSHMLVLRSLSLMRDLSPDYLRRFLSHLGSLLWLDEVAQPRTSAVVRPARRARQKK